LILFENSQRNKDGKKKEGTTTTTIAVDKACAHIKHVDNGSTNTTTWQTLAGLILLQRFLLLNQTETKEAETVQNEKDKKEEEEATTPSSTTTEDEIKQDAASASSSARSTADTSDVPN